MIINANIQVRINMSLRESHWRYNIHGFVQIESNVDLKNQYFKVKDLDPNLIVNVVDRINYDVRHCNKVGWNFYGIPGQDFLYYRGVRSEAFIENIEDSTKLIVNNAFFSKDKGRLWNSLLSAIIFLKLLQNKCSFIHSSCVSIKNHGFLFVAFPDTGKSTTAISMVKQNNAEYLSDDLTIIDRDGRAYCYPTPITMSSKVIEMSINKKIGLKRMLKLKFCSFLQKHLITNYVASKLFRFPPTAYIWDIIKNIKIAREAKVDAICLLEFGKDEIRKVSSDYMLRQANLINWEIVRHLTANFFIIVYSYFNPELELSDYLNTHQEIMEDFLTQAESFIVRSKNGMWHEIIKKQIIPCFI